MTYLLEKLRFNVAGFILNNVVSRLVSPTFVLGWVSVRPGMPTDALTDAYSSHVE